MGHHKHSDRALSERSPAAMRHVHVKVPAKVAYDLDEFMEIQRSILDRLGCQACCSGFDIRWDIQRDFRVDAGGEIMEL